MTAPDRATWLAERRSGVGGSDIAALLGMSPYTTPMQLWLDKTGRAEDTQPDAGAAERMHFGVVLEDVVAAEYSERTHSAVQRINGMLRHPQCDIAIASIDRAVVSDGSRARWDTKEQRVLGADAVLECKTAHALAQRSADWGEAGTDQVPQAYWMQCQWYLGITGLPRADLAVLFGGQRFAIYTIAADAPLFADMLGDAQRWWLEHVVADVPPQPRTEDEARSLWRSHVAGRERVVHIAVARAVDDLRELRLRLKSMQDEEQRLRDLICCSFGEDESITYMGRTLATWRRNKDGTRTDWRAVAEQAGATPEQIAHHTTTIAGARVLRLSQPKE